MADYRRALVAVLLGSLTTGCSLASLGEESPPLGESTTPGEEYPGDAYGRAPALQPLDADVLVGLTNRVDDILADSVVAAASMSILVVDAETEQVIYERNPDLALKPASNTKLFTSALALEVFGEDDRQATTITTEAALVNGVVNGDVVVRGGFDASWSALVLDRSRQGIDVLVAQLTAAGITRIDGTMWIAGEYLLAGERFGTYDAARERSEVATAMSEALAAAGIAVGGVSVGNRTEGSIELARFESPPISVTATPLNRLSHNEFSDIVARYAAQRLTGSASNWTDEVATWSGSFGAEDVLTLYDGSGLSHDNRATARSIIDLFRFMLGRPEGRTWLRTLTIAGVDGTLGNRLTGFDTYGRVWGKTGTLNGVIATSGVVFNRYDGRRYLFSILMNGTGNASSTRAVQDRVIAEIAADLRQDERLAAPELTTAKRIGRSLATTWTEVEGATGYLVWLSQDGRTWSRDQARLVAKNTYRSEALDSDSIYVRVTAVGPRGESDPTSVFGASVGDTRVLLVDGNDRWLLEPGTDNPLGQGHDFIVSYGRALHGLVGFDTVANEVVAAGGGDLGAYHAVVWMAGEDGTETMSLDANERAQLQLFLDDGGKLMISGSEIGWHLAENGTSEEQAFYQTYLRATYLGDDAGTSRARPLDSVFTEARAVGFYSPTDIVVGYPDVLSPGAGATAAIDYDDDLGTAAIAYQGDYSLVYFGFPFESVDNAPERRQLMMDVLDFFGL